MLETYYLAQAQLADLHWLLDHQPDLMEHPDPARLTTEWNRREQAIRQGLRVVIDAIEPHAGPQ
jgi:hypothetical protein